MVPRAPLTERSASSSSTGRAVATEKLPPYMKNKRVSIQWRGRMPEAVAAETVGERAEREGMRHRGEDPGDLATYRREKAMEAMREQQQNKKGGG